MALVCFCLLLYGAAHGGICIFVWGRRFDKSRHTISLPHGLRNNILEWSKSSRRRGSALFFGLVSAGGLGGYNILGWLIIAGFHMHQERILYRKKMWACLLSIGVFSLFLLSHNDFPMSLFLVCFLQSITRV
ncbi:hypothetical protein V2G26_011623 [Clonostachys chloroleuca]